MPVNTANPLNFLCFGAGAIGAYIGGSLALNGQGVVFLERPEVAPRLRQSGLTLTRTGQPEHLAHPEVVDSLDEALTRGPYDAALLAVKAFDTAGLAESLVPYRMALPPILCFQNGVENELLLTEKLGEELVIPATVTTAIGRRGPGEIIVERLRGVGVANTHILTPTLVGALGAAGLRARLYENGPGMKWSKMLTNLLANASSAILDMPPAAIFAHPGLYRLEILQLREALNAMAAQSIGVVDLPSTPVCALAFLARYFPLSLSRPLLRRVLGQGRGSKMPSFHIDLHAGRGQSEVDYLNGAVVRFGQKLGVATPVNAFFTRTLLALTSGELPLDTFAGKPEKLIETFEKT